MPRVVFVLLLLSSFAIARDVVQVEVKAVHQVTHEARDTHAIIDRALMGASATGRSVEVFNLDTIIKDERVILTCEDDKGCEAPTLGIHSAKVYGRGHMKLTFDLPVTHKEVSRWYKIAGAW